MQQNLPDGFQSALVECGDISLHLVHNARSGDLPFEDERTPILFLHGFPEFWIAWQSVFELLCDDYLVLAPDQRGYNLSDAPSQVENYKANLLVQDMINLTQKVLGDRKFVLAGHDWGSSIAYALAMAIPGQISKLIIANGVHPVCFQEAMLKDVNQAKASQYFYVLQADNAGKHMSDHDFARTFSMFEKFSNAPWLDNKLKELYRTAWRDENRMQAMLHWYSSSPIHVPREGVPIPERTLAGASRDKFRIAMPHLLLWGTKDTSLLPSCWEKLHEFCDDLTIKQLANGDHWLLHSEPEWVIDQVKIFLET